MCGTKVTSEGKLKSKIIFRAIYLMIYSSEKINTKDQNRYDFRHREKGETEICWRAMKLFEEGVKRTIFQHLSCYRK